MAHIEKCKASEARQLILHDERRHINKDKHIDPSLTYKNYSLCARPGGGVKYMRDRIKDIMGDRTLRKDAVTAISIIVTAPKTLQTNEYEAFFRSVYNFLVKDFGEENIISAECHNDEPSSQSHLHTKIVPLWGDPPRLSAKNLITRQYLKQFHTRLQKHVEADLGYHVDIINGATPGKSKEIAELKAATALREAEIIRHSIDLYKTELEPLQTEYETKNAYVRSMQKDFSVVGVKSQKDMRGKTKSYKVPSEIWESQRTTQAQKDAIDCATVVYENMIRSRYNTADMQIALRQEVFRLHEELECVRGALERISSTSNNEFFKHYNVIKAQRQSELAKTLTKLPDKTLKPKSIDVER